MLFNILFYIGVVMSSMNATQPADRLLVELNSPDMSCLKEWRQSHQLESYLLKKLPVGNWVVTEVPVTLLSDFRALRCVSDVRQDMPIRYRETEPNDPVYINQDNMRLIGMPEAWDIATGGFTARGDEIVVAVMDDGFQANHKDLASNIWVNEDEIPGDGIDNDNNNYTDDYRGMNIQTGNDDHLVLNHGTEVAGIIGGRGNNQLGLSGINWKVKLMLVSGSNFESELIEAYQYVLDMRKRYRNSNGTSGAFVVATNLSGGLDFAKAEDHPLWCDMYNKLGEEGILSVAAGPNEDISVDIEGDMPTTCTSPFLITVTNVDLTDFKVDNAAYGPVSIDIGAPGQGVISTYNPDGYRNFPGTSASAPHVTGAIALMYSTTCSTFLNNVDSDPESIARKVRDIILSTGSQNNSLEDITVTGRRLQVDAAMEKTVTDCPDIVPAAVKITSVRPNPAFERFANVFFEVGQDTSKAYFELYNPLGAMINSYPISQQEFEQGFLQVDTDVLVPGIYMVTLHNGKARATAKIFVYREMD